MVAVRRPHRLPDELGRLASALETLDLRATALVGEDLTPECDRLAGVIRSYLVPRLDNPGEPLLVVVAGPTGSGKSTLVNSLAGLDLSPTGPLRPTTKTPLVLARTGRHEAGMTVGGVECVVCLGEAPILEHMTLVDTPDIDSTAADHRVVAETLIDHADIVVFVCSGLRYADAVPWEVLRRALSRGAAVIPVLNRALPGAEAALSDFRSLVRKEGIDDDVLRVPEHHLAGPAHQVPSLAIRELRRRLYDIARDRDVRQREMVNRVMNTTLDGVRGLIGELEETARLLDDLAKEIRDAARSAGRLGEEPRPWAGIEVPAPPEKPWRLRRWRRRVEPSPADLALWLRRVADTLTGEMTTRARAVVVSRRAPMVALSGVPILIDEAVDGWFGHVRETVAATPTPRLAAMAAVSAALASEPVAERILDGPSLAGEVRAHLQRRLDVVFTHLGERLVELAEIGEIDTAELTRRLEAVTRSYQFADA
ncbi:MAG: GTPase domain-containing protein [Actinobacteria bacterium]|nr:GTPase domain-containing protein [Actinomycetota bacterium]